MHLPETAGARDRQLREIHRAIRQLSRRIAKLNRSKSRYVLTNAIHLMSEEQKRLHAQCEQLLKIHFPPPEKRNHE